MLLDTIDPPPLTIKRIDPELLEGDLIQPGHPLFGLIWINRARVSGTPCFYASRVPVITLFHCLAGGDTLDESKASPGSKRWACSSLPPAVCSAN